MHPKRLRGIDPSRLRALYLQPAALFGGAERQAATNIPFLREYGVDVVACVGPGQAIVDWLEERGVEDYVFTRNFPGGWKTPRGLGRLSIPWRYARCHHRSRKEVARLVREREIDIIFAALPFTWVVATPVARRLGVPIVWRAGGTEINSTESLILTSWARRRPPDFLICNGQAVRRTYEPLIAAPATVVRNGVDLRQFDPGSGDPTRYRPAGARVVAGFAARLVPQKRPEDFIRVAARFAAEGRDVSFLIAGEGNGREDYAEMARQAGASNVHFLGYVGNMQDFYAACDVLVLPSRSEGCPNVVLEAMAMHKTIVASDSAGTTEVVRHQREGLIYPIGDLDALTAALRQLESDRERMRALADAARQHVMRDLSVFACARRTSELLRNVTIEYAGRAALSAAGYTAAARDLSRPAWAHPEASSGASATPSPTSPSRG